MKTLLFLSRWDEVRLSFATEKGITWAGREAAAKPLSKELLLMLPAHSKVVLCSLSGSRLLTHGYNAIALEGPSN